MTEAADNKAYDDMRTSARKEWGVIGLTMTLS